MPPPIPPKRKPNPNVHLSNDQLRSFYKKGYLVLPNAVPQNVIFTAKRKINESIGKNGSKPNQKITHCPELCTHFSITNLYNQSNLGKGVMRQLLGADYFRLSGQIALRFPGYMTIGDFVPAPWWRKAYHIDGLFDPSNPINPKGKIGNFTALIGVFLSDVDEEFKGNFIVYPGSHHITESYFRKFGVDQVKELGLSAFPPLNLGTPVQIRAKPGDMIIAHYNLAHSIAPNTSSDVRYAVFFRIHTRPLGDEAPLKNIWLEWPGMHKVIDVEKGRKDINEYISSNGMNAGYTESFHEKSEMQQNETKELRKQAKALMKSHSHGQALPILQKLMKQDPNDFELLIEFGICCSVNPNQQYVPIGEDCLRKAISLNPALPQTYSLLSQNLLRQGKHQEIVHQIEKMLECPSQSDFFPEQIITGMKCVYLSLQRLDSLHKWPHLVKIAKEKYNTMSDEFDSIPMNPNIPWIRLLQAKDNLGALGESMKSAIQKVFRFQ